MAGTTFKIEDKEFQRRIAALKKGVVSPAPLMKIWGAIAHRSVMKNFEVEGRPRKWKPLSKVTAAIRGSFHPILVRSGNLKSVTVKPEERRVLIGSNPATRDYAARQQFGWPGGGKRYGGKVKTPARPFILLQDEDKEDMRAEMQHFFVRIGS